MNVPSNFLVKNICVGFTGRHCQNPKFAKWLLDIRVCPDLQVGLVELIMSTIDSCCTGCFKKISPYTWHWQRLLGTRFNNTISCYDEPGPQGPYRDIYFILKTPCRIIYFWCFICKFLHFFVNFTFSISHTFEVLIFAFITLSRK
jgi:hypothetical protein